MHKFSWNPRADNNDPCESIPRLCAEKAQMSAAEARMCMPAGRRIYASRPRDLYWRHEAMLKRRTKFPLKSTTAILRENEVLSSSDDGNSWVHIRKPAGQNSWRLNSTYFPLQNQEVMLKVNIKTPLKWLAAILRSKVLSFSNDNSRAHIGEASKHDKLLPENQLLQKNQQLLRSCWQCFFSSPGLIFMLDIVFKWAIQSQHHADSDQLVFKLTTSYHSTKDIILFRSRFILFLKLSPKFALLLQPPIICTTVSCTEDFTLINLLEKSFLSFHAHYFLPEILAMYKIFMHYTYRINNFFRTNI